MLQSREREPRLIASVLNRIDPTGAVTQRASDPLAKMFCFLRVPGQGGDHWCVVPV